LSKYGGKCNTVLIKLGYEEGFWERDVYGS